LVALLQRGIVSEADLDETLELVRTIFDLTGLVVSNEFSYQGWLRLAGDLGNWPDVYTQLAHTDTTIEDIKLSTPGKWFVIQQAAPVHRKSAVYSAFESEGFRDVAIARLPSIQRDHVTMGLYRDRSCRLYATDDEDLLGLLSPLLARALASKSAMSLLERDRTDASQRDLPVADGWAHVTFPGGRVEWSKPALKLWRTKLGDIGQRGWARLERALVWAVRNRMDAAAAAVRAPRLLRDISVEFANLPPKPRETHRVLALFFEEPELTAADRDPSPLSPAEVLLSKRQRTVARLVARGWQLPQIATELGVSVETVRDHLRTVYERLGVGNRIELARLLA
jgi:DNA-binding CsgD family transcriptional regulator